MCFIPIDCALNFTLTGAGNHVCGVWYVEKQTTNS